MRNIIDYILPYINFEDKEIQDLYKTVMGKEYVNFNNSSYIDLCLTIKLILINLPFINKLYITCKDVQKLPENVNYLIKSSNGKIIRINESEFMPNDFITFSAGCIEMFIWKIPGLSEHFIYGNDDMIPCKKLTSNMFFESGTPIIQITKGYTEVPTIYQHMIFNANALIFDKQTDLNLNYIVLSEHTLRPLTKTICKECYDKYEKFIINSLYPVKFFNNFNIDLYIIYGLKNEMLIDKQLKYKFIRHLLSDNITEVTNYIELHENKSYDEIPHVICFNDNIQDKSIIPQIQTNIYKLMNMLYKDNTIDYVLTYIDYNQKEIQDLYEFISHEPCTKKDNYTYIDIELLIKLIFKKLPFINNLYLVCKDVQTLSDNLTDFINNSNGRIIRVNESEILPEGFTTFSSACIEMFIWKIPGLSEHFIYGNDDMIPLKEMSANMFFNEDDKTLNLIRYCEYPFTDLYAFHCSNNTNLIFNRHSNNGDYNNICLCEHTFRSLKKSMCEECYNVYQIMIFASLYPIRFYNNFNMDLYVLYAATQDHNISDIKHNFKYISLYNINSLNEYIEVINNKEYEKLPHVSCINDCIENKEDVEEIKLKLNEIFNELLK